MARTTIEGTLETATRTPAGDGLFAHILGGLAILGPVVSLVASPGITLVFVAAGLAALAGLWRQGALGEMRRAPIAALFAALIAWALLSALWAIEPHESLTLVRGLTPLFIGIVAVQVAARRLDEPARRRFAGLLVIGFLVGTAMLALDVATGDQLNRWLKLLATGKDAVGGGVVDRPVVLALLSSFAAALALSRLGWKWAALAILIPAPLISFYTNSESARLAVLVGLTVAAAVWLLGPWLVRLGGLAAAALALAMPLLPLGPLAPDHWHTLLEGEKYSAIHRLYIWHFAAGRIREHPILGWGMNSARSIPGGKTILPTGGQALSLHPHNGLLQIWLELGVPGALLAAAFLWLCFSAVARIEDKFARSMAAGMLVTGLGIACLSFGIWQNWWVSTLGLVAAYVMVLLPGTVAISPPRRA